MRALWIALGLLVIAAAGLDAGDIYYPDANPAKGSTVQVPWGQTEVRYQNLVPTGAMGSKPIRLIELWFSRLRVL